MEKGKSTRNGQNLITFRSGARSYHSSLPPPPNFLSFRGQSRPISFEHRLWTFARHTIELFQWTSPSSWKFNESSLFTGNSPNGGRGFIIDRARDTVRSTDDTIPPLPFLSYVVVLTVSISIFIPVANGRNHPLVTRFFSNVIRECRGR